jgi:predicted membrane-bound mannosyltransferase
MYLTWLLRIEGSLLLLGAIGAVIVVLKPKNSLALFCALWAFGLIAAYSLIPYKTPWLVLNFVVPLALIAGYAIQAIYEMDHGQLRLVSAILVVAIAIATYQSIDLNFVNYDNDDTKYVYVYAHTTRGMLDLVNQVEQIAKENSGPTTGISIISPDYWPLPWYFRNFTRVGYFGRMAATSEPIIIANENQKQEVEQGFGEMYRQVESKSPGGSFQLRPGVNLLLYVRRPGLLPERNPPSIQNP